MDKKPRFSRRSADRLLDGVPGEDAQQVAGLLAAVHAGPAAHELRGERAAVARFRSAYLAGAGVSSKKTSLIKSAIANLLATKALIGGAVAVAASGGIALAASTGALPGLTGHAAPGNSIVASSRASHGTSPSAGGANSHPATPSGSPAAPGNTGPSPSLAGLCRAYQAGPATNPGKALHNPAFTALLAAAGGPGNITSFCAGVLGTPPPHPGGHSAHRGGKPSTHPGRAPGGPRGAHSAHPGGKPSTHPGGAPATQPGGAHATHPGGAPSTHPAGAPTRHLSGRPTTDPTRQPRRCIFGSPPRLRTECAEAGPGDGWRASVRTDARHPDLSWFPLASRSVRPSAYVSWRR